MTAKIKLNAASGGGSVSIQAPSSSSNNRVYTLPDSAHISTLAGITEVDQWYLTANVTSDGDITSLARNNFSGTAAPLGTGMSVSSGIFTFPSTGKYLVIVQARFSIHDSDNCYVGTNVTLNNSSYTIVNYAADGQTGSDGNRDGMGSTFSFIDVTDTAQVKVKFNALSIGTDSKIVGGTGNMDTTFLFIRMGDT